MLQYSWKSSHDFTYLGPDRLHQQWIQGMYSTTFDSEPLLPQSYTK